MLSKAYLPNHDDKQLYRLNLKDYSRIKNWLSSVKHNYQPLPSLSNAFEYYPLNYVYSFKRIHLEQHFANKYVRQLNFTANNGFRILAGVEDSSRNVFVGKLYEKKELFCNVDIINRTVSCLDDITLAFFTLDQRLPGRISNVGPNLKNYYFVLQFQLASNKGDIFNLGTARHCLADRLKQAVIDIQLNRIGSKQKIGHVQFHIDSPQKLGLSYLLPANVIIDQNTIIPPCRKLQLKNKSTPYALLQHYYIKLQNLQIKINNYDKLLKSLERCNPYFTQYHHENIRMEILRINFIIGFHNGWMVLNDVPGLNKDKDKDKDKERLSPRHASPTKNISRFHSIVETKKSQPIYSVYQSIRLISSVKSENRTQKRATLKPEQSHSLSNLNEGNEGIHQIYFDSDQGQLIGILQFTLKFVLESTIKEEKTVKANTFWSPITFNTAQSSCQVKIPMIEHIELPGYPIEWNKIQSNKEVSTQMSYQCINQNPQLHKITKKQRMNSYSAIKPQAEFEMKEKSYLDLLMEEQNDPIPQANNDAKIRVVTNTSLITKEEEVTIYINKMLRKLEKSLKPRLRLKQNRFNRQLLENSINSRNKVKGLSLVGKSFHIKFRLREYLPVTDCVSQHYIPRKLNIQLYAFRHTFSQQAYINKDSVKSGIPIQLQNPSKMDYQGFIFEFNVLNINEEEAGAYEDGNNIVVQIYDTENMLYYGGGMYPVMALFDNDHIEQESDQSINNKIKPEKEEIPKYFKVQLRSKMSNNESKMYGFLLFQSTVTYIPPQSHNSNTVTQQIKLSQAMKQLSTKQRQLLRIQTLAGKEQASIKKQQIIQRFKQSNRYNNANQIAHKQFNNDLQLQYEIGRPTYDWLKLNNTDSSGNNVFTFTLDCDFVELVTDKAEYQRKALADIKVNQNGNKVIPNLAYVVGKQGAPGYYQAKIPQGTQTDILIKILNNEYYKAIKQTTIVTIQVKRNTFLFKKYKLRLNFKKPLLDRVYHLDIVWSNSNNNQIKIKLPDYIFEESGDYVGALTMNTLYNNKERLLSLAKIDVDSVGETGLVVQVLMGVYFDKYLQYLRSTVLLEIQCMQGEKVKLYLGDLQPIKIPICSENLKTKDRIYRMETSNDECRLLWDSFGKLHYFSEIQRNEPELLLRSLWPRKDELIISIISLEGRLIKKYMIQIECSMPTRCQLEEIEVEGTVGQKMVLVLKNPYHIDYPFYISSTTEHLQFRGLEFQKNKEQQFIFNIKARSHLRITAQIKQNIRSQEYMVLSDYQHCVISIFHIRAISKIRHILNVTANLGLPDRVGESDTSLMDKMEKMENSASGFFGPARNSGF